MKCNLAKTKMPCKADTFYIKSRQGVIEISWLKQEFCVKFGPRIRSQKLAIDQPSRRNILAQQIAHGFMLSTPLVFHSRREHEKLLKPLRAMTLTIWVLQVYLFLSIFFMYGRKFIIRPKIPSSTFCENQKWSFSPHHQWRYKREERVECKERHTWSVSSHDAGLSLKSESSKSSNDFRFDFEEKLNVACV